MKRAANLYNNITDINNIINMTDEVLSKVKNKRRKEKFILHKMEHVINIKNRLESENINLGRYNIFFITDPKFRVIMSQSIEDKIINHLIAKYFLVRVFEPKYIDSMCATRIGRGTSYAINLMKKYLNIMKLKYNDFYILKLDIKKYFYNIDHEILKEIVKSNIKDYKALCLLEKVIDSTNAKYINEEIIRLKTSNHINDNIPLYYYGKGCGIGDQTSQAFGLIYLNDICYYIKEDLHIKYFVNFMDDFVIIHCNKNYLKECLILIKDKLKNEYKLELNDKTRIYHIKEGIEFLGFRFIIKKNKLTMKLRNSTKNRIKKKIKKIKVLRDNLYIDNNKYNNIMASLIGHLKYGNCRNLCRRIVND